MKALIISGGNEPDEEIMKKELASKPFIICADSGANYLYKYNVIPGVLIGDFDSINEEILNFFILNSCIIERYPKEKDLTDTELALNKAIEQGFSDITFLSCTGSRLDHTLGNIGLLLKCLKNNINGKIIDNNNEIIIFDKPFYLERKCGITFSIIAYSKDVIGLSIKGSKYDIQDYDLKIGDPLTISNVFLENKIFVNFDSGTLLVLFSKD